MSPCRTNGRREGRTDKSGRKVFEVDAERRLDRATTGHDAAALQCPLDGAQRVVQSALHLVQEVVCAKDIRYMSQHPTIRLWPLSSGDRANAKIGEESPNRESPTDRLLRGG